MTFAHLPFKKHDFPWLWYVKSPAGDLLLLLSSLKQPQLPHTGADSSSRRCSASMTWESASVFYSYFGHTLQLGSTVSVKKARLYMVHITICTYITYLRLIIIDMILNDSNMDHEWPWPPIHVSNHINTTQWYFMVFTLSLFQWLYQPCRPRKTPILSSSLLHWIPEGTKHVKPFQSAIEHGPKSWVFPWKIWIAWWICPSLDTLWWMFTKQTMKHHPVFHGTTHQLTVSIFTSLLLTFPDTLYSI